MTRTNDDGWGKTIAITLTIFGGGYILARVLMGLIQ